MNYRKKNEQIKNDWSRVRGKIPRAKYLIREIDGCESHVVDGEWRYDRVPMQLIEALYDYLWKEVHEYERNCRCSTEENRSSTAM